jgi:hypothetical protein
MAASLAAVNALVAAAAAGGGGGGALPLPGGGSVPLRYRHMRD